LAQDKNGITRQAICFPGTIEKILVELPKHPKSKTKGKVYKEHKKIDWIVFDEKGDLKFYSDERFRRAYKIKEAKKTCSPQCHPLLEVTTKTRYVVEPYYSSLYRCQSCGALFVAKMF
jgi:hypothetical protein